MSLSYYASTLMKEVEIWIRKFTAQLIPVHELATKFGLNDCRLHPFLYAFSGKDDASFFYGIGKSKVLKQHQKLDCTILAHYGEDNNY